MSLPGQGFLAIWNDVVSTEEAEWLRWHTREHMPERVGVPGFTAGRRYVDPAVAHHRYFTLYVGESVVTFSSPPYLERLNNPTPWTTRTSPHFRNFVRGACRLIAGAGGGVGGAMATVRIVPSSDEGRIEPAAAARLVDRVTALDGLVGCHIGLADASVTGVPTRERAMRGNAQEPVFYGVVMIEGLGRADLGRAMPAIGEAIRDCGLGVTIAETGIYDLSLSLTKSDLS